MPTTIRTVAVESLGTDVPVIPKEAVGFWVQNCIVCFGLCGHQSGIKVPVEYERNQQTFCVVWNGEFNDDLQRQYGDTSKATDNAACAIALLLTPEITGFVGVETSSIGTTIDYYLSPKDQEDTYIFDHAARLEVSGILRENKDNTVRGRVREKINRLKPDPAGDLPTYIFVMEFSRPWAVMAEP